MKLAKKYLFFGEYFCPTYFFMTESTELRAFKRQKDGYKVTVKISLCICVVLSWDELKVRQNFFGNYCIQKTKMSRSINDSFVGWSQSMVTIVNLIDKLHTDLANWSVFKCLILHANLEICCSVKSFAGGTCGFSYREDRTCISLVVPLHSCKNTFQVTCGFQIQKMKLILFCSVLTSSRRRKIQWFYNLSHS